MSETFYKDPKLLPCKAAAYGGMWISLHTGGKDYVKHYLFSVK